MSCFHGNHPDACDICDEVDAASKRGYEAGFKACLRENFTATPQRTWVGLTDEEIKALANWWPSYDQMPALIVLAKDIQNAFKEKNT